MLDQLSIVHSKKPQKLESSDLLFETCLRSISIKFGDKENLPHGEDTFFDRDAYSFLLQILCGLNSPILGENEVFGQFKEWLADQNSRASVNQKFSQSLLADVKELRRKFFREFGSQSYGSIARRVLKESDSVSFIGFGQLTENILPWLSKNKSRITIYVRSPEKYAANSNYVIRNLKDFSDEKNLLICAPVAHKDLADILKEQELDYLVDLRDDSKDFKHLKAKKHLTLKDFFNQYQQSKDEAENLKEKILKEISKLSLKRWHQESHRPFGWEDLC